MARTTADIVFAIAMLSACAPAPPESDASRQDAFVVSRDASLCTLTPPDALPMLGGNIVVLDPDAGFQIPAQDGGNPIGVWRVAHVTIFASPGVYDASASITGSAWVIVTATEVQLSLDLAIGAHHDALSLRGSYTRDGPTLHVAPGCGTTALDLDFTSGDTSGTLLFTIGQDTLLLHCARTST